jgi:hypothetical protein
MTVLARRKAEAFIKTTSADGGTFRRATVQYQRSRGQPQDESCYLGYSDLAMFK